MRQALDERARDDGAEAGALASAREREGARTAGGRGAARLVRLERAPVGRVREARGRGDVAGGERIEPAARLDEAAVPIDEALAVPEVRAGDGAALRAHRERERAVAHRGEE